jgi:DnaA-like protein
MASLSFAPNSLRRIPLAEIDAVVSARLGPTRGLGNSQPACFNRQVSMYLASHVGRWSTTVIGRFYNGRDHSTVCHGIQRIQALRESDPEVDALLTELKQQLGQDWAEAACGDGSKEVDTVDCARMTVDELAELVAARVCAYLERRFQHLS